MHLLSDATHGAAITGSDFLLSYRNAVLTQFKLITVRVNKLVTRWSEICRAQQLPLLSVIYFQQTEALCLHTPVTNTSGSSLHKGLIHILRT